MKIGRKPKHASRESSYMVLFAVEIHFARKRCSLRAMCRPETRVLCRGRRPSRQDIGTHGREKKVNSSVHFIFHYPYTTPICYSSFHFVFHYPYITPINPLYKCWLWACLNVVCWMSLGVMLVLCLTLRVQANKACAAFIHHQIMIMICLGL